MKSSYIVELRRIPGQSKFHLFQGELTNDMVTLGMKTRAMWHQTSGHLAHGRPSVMFLSCMIIVVGELA